MDYTVSILDVQHRQDSWVDLATFRYRVDAMAYASRASWDDFDKRTVRITGEGEILYYHDGERIATVREEA